MGIMEKQNILVIQAIPKRSNADLVEGTIQETRSRDMTSKRTPLKPVLVY